MLQDMLTNIKIKIQITLIFERALTKIQEIKIRTILLNLVSRYKTATNITKQCYRALTNIKIE